MPEPILATLAANTLWAIYGNAVEKLSEHSARKLVRALRGKRGLAPDSALQRALVRCWTGALTHFCECYETQVGALVERVYLADMRALAEGSAAASLAAEFVSGDDAELTAWFSSAPADLHNESNLQAIAFIEARIGPMPPRIRAAILNGIPSACPDWSGCFSRLLTQEIETAPDVFQVFTAKHLAAIEASAAQSVQSANRIEAGLEKAGQTLELLARASTETHHDVRWIVDKLNQLSAVSDQELIEIASFFGVFDAKNPADARRAIEDKATELGVLKERVVQQEEAERELAKIAFADHLTGAPNRSHFHRTLTERQHRVGSEAAVRHLAFIDLDSFFSVNNAYGHDVGDHVLSEVARRLNEVALMHDVAFCRYGGDEFLLGYYAAADETERLETIAEAACCALREPISHDPHTLRLTASAGLSVDAHTVLIEHSIKQADLALYRAKDEGRDRIMLFDPAIRRAAEERRVLEAALRQASENGEFHLVYAPIMRSADLTLIGFEALLRWEHPEFGTISPARFVPLAEENQLIREIGKWVLNTACADAANWPGAATVSVNISPEQLSDDEFAGSICSALERSGLPPHRLELEVTESAFLREAVNAAGTLHKLADLGIGIILDDFGTGYSSLGYLSRTRFRSIKIDRSFVQAAARNQLEALAIIRGVVALGDVLGIAITAEGIESEHDLALIRNLGCSRAQGYHLGRPLPEGDAKKLLGSV